MSSALVLAGGSGGNGCSRRDEAAAEGEPAPDRGGSESGAQDTDRPPDELAGPELFDLAFKILLLLLLDLASGVVGARFGVAETAELAELDLARSGPESA